MIEIGFGLKIRLVWDFNLSCDLENTSSSSTLQGVVNKININPVLLI